jgi:hypothetical protein
VGFGPHHQGNLRAAERLSLSVHGGDLDREPGAVRRSEH